MGGDVDTQKLVSCLTFFEALAAENADRHAPFAEAIARILRTAEKEGLPPLCLLPPAAGGKFDGLAVRPAVD